MTPKDAYDSVQKRICTEIHDFFTDLFNDR